MFLVAISCYAIAQENRTFSGENNNLSNPTWGSANSVMPRVTSVNYADGFAALSNDAPNAREVSNAIFDQQEKIDNNLILSDYVWAFGQFLDHDISLTSSNPHDVIQWSVPQDDEFFNSNVPMELGRSEFVEGTGTDINNPRQFNNEVSAFLDASMVYGSDIERANWLRTLDGSGKMKTSSNGNFLPANTTNGDFDSSFLDPNAPEMDNEGNSTLLFVAGDVRANENPLLLTLHTLFVKEHNRMCDELSVQHPNWTGEQIYQRARKYIGGFIQNITYNEWLPAMKIDVPPYAGYVEDLNPSVSNEFASAAFRMGHTLINSSIVRLDDDGEVISDGNMTLQESFFDPQLFVLTGSIEPFLKGMATQMQQEMDCKVISDVRNFLFDEQAGLGMDLVSINIMRGRERGLPDYNTIRDEFGLAKISDFSDLTSDQETVDAMTEIYGDVNEIDAWVGMLSEEHMPGAMVGEVINRILKDQFQKLRSGDRFYFEHDPAFSESDKARIKNTTLHDIIMRNTNISLMQDNVFTAMDHTNIPNGPQLIKVQLDASVYPNPLTDESFLKVYAEFEDNLELRMFNSGGVMVAEKTASLYHGENFIPIDFHSEVIRGVYFLQLISGDYHNVIKVVKEY